MLVALDEARLAEGDAASAQLVGQHSSSRSLDWRQSRAHYEQSLTEYRKVSGTWFQATSNANQAAEKIRRCDAALAGST
jgi:hypothetical protein